MANKRQNFIKFLENNKKKIVEIGGKFMKKIEEEKEKNPNITETLQICVLGLRQIIEILNKLEVLVRGY